MNVLVCGFTAVGRLTTISRVRRGYPRLEVSRENQPAIKKSIKRYETPKSGAFQPEPPTLLCGSILGNDHIPGAIPKRPEGK